MAINEQSSDRLASLASQVLRDPASTEVAKSLAACGLTQAPDHKASANALMRNQSHSLIENALATKPSLVDYAQQILRATGKL